MYSTGLGLSTQFTNLKSCFLALFAPNVGSAENRKLECFSGQYLDFDSPPASAEPTVDRLERFSDYLQLVQRVLTA